MSRRQVVPTSGHLGVRTFTVVERGLRLKKLCPLARLPGTGVDASASTPSVRANGAPQAGPRPRPEPAFGDTPTKADPGAIGGAHDASRSGYLLEPPRPRQASLGRGVRRVAREPAAHRSLGCGSRMDRSSPDTACGEWFERGLPSS